MVTSIVSHQTYLQDVLARQARRRLKVAPDHEFPFQPVISSTSSSDPGPSGTSGQPSKANVVNYVPEEETIRNDYTAWYGVSGKTGANYILGAADHAVCEEYPALRRLMDLKSTLVSSQAHPPLYLTLPAVPQPESLVSALTPHKFDVILVHPRGSWSETADLPIRQLSADPGFVFLWVGRGDQDGLERGRECLARWGFRRAEDIVCVKTNRLPTRPTTVGDTAGSDAEDPKVESDEAGRSRERGPNRGAGGGGLFSSQKEHCLMGIRGTVRRSTDTRFVHCNVDTDVMVWEQDGDDSPEYPPYLYTLIESFCLGTRRLQLFAPPHRSRRGWITASTEPLPPGLTVPGDTNTPTNAMSTVQSPTRPSVTLLSPHLPSGHTVASSSEPVAEQVLQFDGMAYPALMPPTPDGHSVLPYHPEIDSLRPKSPQRRGRGGPPTGPGGFGGTSPPPQSTFRGGSFRGGARGRGTGRGGMGQGNYGVQQPYPMGPGYGQFDQFGQPLDPSGQMYDPRLSQGMMPGMGMDPMMAMQRQQMQQMQMMGMGMGMYGMNPGMNIGQPGFNPMQGFDSQMAYMMQQQQMGGGQFWNQQVQYGPNPQGQGQGEWYGGQAE